MLGGDEISDVSGGGMLSGRLLLTSTRLVGLSYACKLESVATHTSDPDPGGVPSQTRTRNRAPYGSLDENVGPTLSCETTVSPV